MVWQRLATRAVPTVVTGLVGAAAFEALAKAPWREATVSATAVGLRAARATGRATRTGAEHTRLAVADVYAEAKDRLGERAAPPPESVTPVVNHEDGNACH